MYRLDYKTHTVVTIASIYAIMAKLAFVNVIKRIGLRGNAGHALIMLSSLLIIFNYQMKHNSGSAKEAQSLNRCYHNPKYFMAFNRPINMPK